MSILSSTLLDDQPWLVCLFCLYSSSESHRWNWCALIQSLAKIAIQMSRYLSFSPFGTIHLSAKMFVSLPPSAGWPLKPNNPSECVSLSCLTTESWRTNPLPPQSEWAAHLAPASRTVCQQTPALNPCPPSLRRRGTSPATRSYPYSQQRKVWGQYKTAFVLNTTENTRDSKKLLNKALRLFLLLLYCYL